MPCRCDYMEPTRREIELTTVKQLLAAADRRGYINMPRQEIAKIRYRGNVDELTALLCKTIREAPQEKFGTDRSKGGLALAMWWLEHQEADAKREAEEAEEARQNILRRDALAKLSPEEREALGV